MARYPVLTTRIRPILKLSSNSHSRNLFKPNHASTPVKILKKDHLSRLRLIPSKNHSLMTASRKRAFIPQSSLALHPRTNTFSNNLGFSSIGRAEGAAVENDDEEEESSGDEENVGWIEGRTLVEGVHGYQEQEDDTALDIDAKLAIVNSLQDPFGGKSSSLKKETLEVLEGSLKQLDLVHSHIDDAIIRKQLSEMGLVAWDTAAEEWHSKLLGDQQDLQTATDESLQRIKVLFASLKAEYKKRDELWTTLETALDETAVEGETVIAELQGSIENVIGVAEKKGKALVSDRASGGVTKGGKGKVSELDKIKAMMKNI